MNPHEGTVLLTHAGRTVGLQFKWDSVAALQAEWGDEYAQRLVTSLDGRKVEDMAILIARASGMTVAEVNDWSPPIIESANVISQAWACAWLGPERAAKAKEGGETPNPLTAPSMLSRLLLKARSALASAGPNSGSSPPTQPAKS